MSSSSLRIFESCRTTVLASSYYYSTPKLTPLLGRHQQSVFGWHQLPDPSPSAATRRVHCSSLRRQCCATTAAGHYFHPSNVCPPRCEPASCLGESERLARWRETQGRDTHYYTLHTHHTRTHATPLPPPTPSFSTINPRLLQSSRRHRPFAAPRSIEPTPTPSRDSPVLSDAAFHCTHHGYLQTPALPTPILRHSLFTERSSLSFLGENSGTAHWRC